MGSSLAVRCWEGRACRAGLQRLVATLRIPFEELLLRSQLADRNQVAVRKLIAVHKLVVMGIKAERHRKPIVKDKAGRTELALVAVDIPFIVEGSPFAAEDNPFAAENSRPFRLIKMP